MKLLHSSLCLSIGLLCAHMAWSGLTKVPKDTLVAFLKKTKACRVAITGVENGLAINPVYCIWDGVANPGSIHEHKGCFLGRFDTETSDATRRYSPILNMGAGLQARSQPDGSCTKELIVKMLTEYPMKEFLSYGGSKEPVLVSFRKQSKNFQVVYDPENIVGSDVLDKVDHWVAPKATSKKKIDCTSPANDEEEIECTPPDALYSQVCNLPNDDQRLKKASYRRKTGKEMPPCR